MALTKRQRQILDYIAQFIAGKGYSPSLEEIGAHFGLTSVATVHKHVSLLVEKGFVRRGWNQNRSIEIVPQGPVEKSVMLPLAGTIAAGRPIEAVEQDESIAVPESLVARGERSFVLRVRGNSMVDEQIKDGDFVVVNERQRADNGEMVIAMLHGNSATVKKFYRERDGRIRLQPANETMAPIYVHENDITIQGIVVGVMRRY
jgi:repressor LexA